MLAASQQRKPEDTQLMHLSQFTYLDYSGEKSTVQIYNGDITAVSLPGFLTQFSAFKTALNAITLGNLHQEAWIGDRTVLTNALPSNAWAQREIKWLVRYRDNTSQKLFNLEIPTADLGGVTLLPDSDFADLTASPMSLFVTAFEDLARSPDDAGHTVTVDSVQVVGRNI